ncbi:MAG: DUF1269 domain-containing protein [Ilumatobacter sp.]|uniref:DUF1269 domain-containing protein n=1 Tax=Ilumatobacter sp. TaxID=1967498 RepID=UPI003C72214E
MTSSDSASNQDSTAPEATEPDTGAPAFDPPDPMLRAGIGDDHEAIFDPQADVIIGVSFDNVIKAQEYLLAMGRLRQSGALELHDAVTVTKGDDGKVNVTETIDPTPGRAAMSGGMWMGLLGLLVGGPVGWVAGIGLGAGAGAVAAKVIDLGIPDEWVDWFKDAVEPGTSTVAILARHVHVHALAAEARRFQGAELLYTSLPSDAIAELDAAFSGS